jgi:uncharacterized membrane protein (DUF4010 family)
MNPALERIVSIVIAAVGGLAVGLERQWSGHASGPRARFAGVRTFTLLGTVAGLAGWMWTQQLLLLAAVLLSGAVALVVAAYVAAARHDVEGTTEVAALVVIAAGLLAGAREWRLAAGVIVVMTLLLVEKAQIHAWARSLDDTSLRAGIRFGVMALVVLPLLPEGPYGPWGGLRPRALWMVVLLFSGISFAGYIARRTLGSSGYPIAGMLGGLISSTSVALTFSQHSRTEKTQAAALATGVVAASTVLFVRVLVAVALLNAALVQPLAIYFAGPFLAGTVITLLGMRSARHVGKSSKAASNPLEFWSALKMAAVFQAMFYMIFWLRETWGDAGILVSGAIMGLADMDALTVAMARGGVEAATAARALAVGVVSNTVLKTTLTLVIGRGSYRWLAAGGLGLLGAALVLAILLLR